jgi:hypothetical protein
VREGEYRTNQGAVIVVREWWHKEKGRPAYRHLEARRKLGGELIAEYTAASPGNPAMVFEAFLAGIFDLSTPLSACCGPS